MLKSLIGEKHQIYADVYFSVRYIVQTFPLEELVFLFWLVSKKAADLLFPTAS